jgi:hypothetical protein
MCFHAKAARRTGLYRDNHGICRRDEWRAVVDEQLVPTVLGLQIDRRLPVNQVQILRWTGRERNVLRVSRETVPWLRLGHQDAAAK